eukprot:GHVS01037953.1.p1 GENE.GHVS01037953.1~~GHVS01037953.1.p1  ORF type:complete len:137 (-),score=11.79 GHVS01037953.1:196-606(-)
MPQIEAKLKSGSVVIADRYSFSGVAYAEGAQGLCRSWCLSADAGLLAPDAVVYLDLSPAKASERNAYGAEIYEKTCIQEKVYTCYQQFLSYPNWLVFDASLNQQDLADAIFAKISELLSARANAPCGSVERRGLWW